MFSGSINNKFCQKLYQMTNMWLLSHKAPSYGPKPPFISKYIQITVFYNDICSLITIFEKSLLIRNFLIINKNLYLIKILIIYLILLNINSQNIIF